MRSHVVETEEENEYKEYFQYLVQACHLSKPENWREALQQYHTIFSHRLENFVMSKKNFVKDRNNFVMKALLSK